MRTTSNPTDSRVNPTYWRKSSRSADTGGNCVEVGLDNNEIQAIRDSKAPEAGALSLTPTQSGDFFAAVKAGRFDRPRPV
ncbi:DUF397 domain-containing protein [Actinoalloteichus hymeniacidonis]|uniref:DUF397 family protein n=1 Tax=Actinoalloteichus hymeniacidonis TaxID=340345 RepID=A0AAC9HPS9_9PSEU|nr:DUF397 domain-containing protein [Actinoalloteichus hymeniacidonis]AOS63183.1 putative DUF397 family protein [Actinoalloteichus hymeniacidonis]MBB5908780.1 hypothetical protein [Actinoalloteichus hymeniacidonis]